MSFSRLPAETVRQIANSIPPGDVEAYTAFCQTSRRVRDVCAANATERIRQYYPAAATALHTLPRAERSAAARELLPALELARRVQREAMYGTLRSVLDWAWMARRHVTVTLSRQGRSAVIDASGVHGLAASRQSLYLTIADGATRRGGYWQVVATVALPGTAGVFTLRGELFVRRGG